ncbi:MAG: alkaline phosphatase [Bacteroidia bacterium]|nr:alkaline phosphatase [Bacteroidia bacterium]
MNLKRLLSSSVCLWIVIAFISCNSPVNEGERQSKPKNVILLIGDGMGLTQVSSRYYFGEGEPSFSRFKHIGLSRTSSSRQKITDSAAGATAFASGKKTYNGAVGVDDDTVAIPTIIELASPKGIQTGVIATSSITHATPAAFYAHVYSRNEHEAIAQYLLHSNVDFFAGGGLEYFNKRRDKLNYLDSLKVMGFGVDTTGLNPVEGKPAYLLANDGMPKMVEGRGDFLPKATELALSELSNSKEGFFLMVEGSQIDWGGHANDGEYIVTEVQDFDKVLGIALDFAEKDGNTLVVVTADHETGGFSLVAGKRGDIPDYRLLDYGFSTGGHSASMVPVFAYGPGSEDFGGIYQNTEIYHKIMKATGW